MALPSSPTVVVLENDNSIFAPNVESSIAGIVGFATKGPTNEATLITSQNALINKFGKPSSDIPGQGLEAALEILEATNQVYFVRAANSSAAPASIAVTVGFAPSIKIPSTDIHGSSVIYSLYDNSRDVATAAKTITLVSSTGITSVAAIWKNAFNKELVNDVDVFATTDSNGELYLAGRYAGSSAYLTLSGPAALSFSSMNANGGSSTVGSSITASGGTAVTTGASSLVVSAYSFYDGAGYNLSSLRDGTVVGLSVEIESTSFRDRLVVNSEGSERESFLIELTPSSPASIEYMLVNDEARNESEYIYTEILASGASFSANVKNNPADVLGASRSFSHGGSITFATPRFVKLVEGTYGLANGNSGYSTTEAGSTDDVTALIGTQTTKTGMYALDDDSLNISMALVPGISNQSVQNALITLAETSKNFIAIVAPPQGYDEAQDAIDWMNGRLTRTAAINSSYVSVYWPWVQVFNYYAGADEWYDPAIFAARQYAVTDNVSEPWFAPAGFRRGRLQKPSDVEVGLNQGDKDSLYSNNINPVAKENQSGIVIMGQKTGQRAPTALNSVNVRRLMIFVRKVLLILGKPFQFEPNDEFTWELVEDSIQPFLDDLLARRAITAGAVKCDSTTNTPLRVDRKELWCSITIKPTLAAETVVFEVNLTNQSATING